MFYWTDCGFGSVRFIGPVTGVVVLCLLNWLQALECCVH